VAPGSEDKPEEGTAGDEAAVPSQSSQETAVGHSVIEEPASEPQPAAAPPAFGAGGTSPAAADRQAAEAEDGFSERPELFVAGAFVGALVLGKLLKRLTRGSEG
jgi:hypothetical protein